VLPENLDTRRLRLRRWRAADRAPFAALNADPEVMEFFPASLSRAESDAMIERIEATFDREGRGLWAVEERASRAFLGFVGLNPVPKELPPAPGVEIGWRLGRAAWGRGIATEAAREVLRDAFERCGLDSVVSFTSASNSRSRSVMRSIGLWHEPDAGFDHPRVDEGPLRAHVLYRLDAVTWRCQQLPTLRPSRASDRPFLERLHRDAYKDLHVATWGSFDEERFARHESTAWEQAGISVVEERGRAVGMLQLWCGEPGLVVQEIQVRPEHQNRGLGARLLNDVAGVAHAAGVDVVTSTGLQNHGATRLYERLGFVEVRVDETHRHMRWRC